MVENLCIHTRAQIYIICINNHAQGFIYIHMPQIAIVSQEDAAIWIGNLDTDNWSIYGPGNIYHFPYDILCISVLIYVCVCVCVCVNTAGCGVPL